MATTHHPPTALRLSAVGGIVSAGDNAAVTRLLDPYELELERNGTRKARGSYYTPARLVDCLIEGTLAPALRAARTAEEILKLRVCDPACGTGRLLAAAGKQMAARLARLRGERSAAQARREVAERCLFGVDVDAEAVERCRAVLAEMGADAAVAPRNLRVADGLGDFRFEIPDFNGFDVVLANPPFVNGVEGGLTAEARDQLRERFPIIRGTADLAYYFLARCVELVRHGGRVGIIQPRPGLNAPSTAALRAMLNRGDLKALRPNVIFAPDRSDLFGGALVYACAVVLGPAKSCRVSVDGERWERRVIDDDNWWAAAHGVKRRAESTRLGEVFEVRAGMTAAEAYDLRPFVNEEGDGLRLVTTGLIDPHACFWGQRRCRYLKRDYSTPRVAVHDEMSAALQRRIEMGRRPKVMVAGLSKRVECFLDEAGEYIGAVSTFGVFHPKNDVAALRRVCAYLLGKEVANAFRRELGANAVGGGDTVMKKAFLAGLRWPGE